jgi:hypothetical protein
MSITACRSPVARRRRSALRNDPVVQSRWHRHGIPTRREAWHAAAGPSHESLQMNQKFNEVNRPDRKFRDCGLDLLLHFFSKEPFP